MKPHVLLVSAMLAACGSVPAQPRWETSAYHALENFKQHYLAGKVTSAQQDFAAAQSAYSSTGRLDLAARAELIHCALGVSALDFEACAGVAAHLPDARAEDQAYGALLAGDWSNNASANVPAQYRDLAKASTAEARNEAVRRIEDPLSRLIGAGVLFRTGEIAPNTVTAAVDAATAQGWRRPLLAWLHVQLKQAQAAGDTAQAADIQRRLDFAARTQN